jgi:hypothetical protein
VGHDAIEGSAEAQPSPASARRKKGSRDIDDEGCGTDAEALTVEAMPSIQPYGSLPGGPGGKASGHLGRPRSVRHDAFQAQISAAFASLRTA